ADCRGRGRRLLAHGRHSLGAGTSAEGAERPATPETFAEAVANRGRLDFRPVRLVSNRFNSFQRKEGFMSHIVTIQTEVRDLAAVRAACKRLELDEPKTGTAKL